MRKLASIQRIAEIQLIDGADAICAYRVNGWWIVDQINKYVVDQQVIYFETDSWIPHLLAPFLSKGNPPRVFNDVEGERLRTIRLRGQISQGLLVDPQKVPLSCFSIENQSTGDILYFGDLVWEDEQDVSDQLGIQKWEAPVNAQLVGIARGNFPSWGRKTDQERCQNIWSSIKHNLDRQYEVTIKLDGSSCSIGWHPSDGYVVCSRNLALKTDQQGNSFVDVAQKHQLEAKLSALGRPILISGELVGPGIQKNQEKFPDVRLFVFDIYDPITGKYLPQDERVLLCKQLELDHIPIIHASVSLEQLGITTLPLLLEFAEGPSLNAKQREGLVFKSLNGSFSFKSISNLWLLKNE